MARLNGTSSARAQLVRPPRNNEAQAFAASTDALPSSRPMRAATGSRRMLTSAWRRAPARLGYQVLNLDVRETQAAAIRLYESLGYIRWGEHPAYARVAGRDDRGLLLLQAAEAAAARKP